MSGIGTILGVGALGLLVYSLWKGQQAKQFNQATWLVDPNYTPTPDQVRLDEMTVGL